MLRQICQRAYHINIKLNQLETICIFTFVLFGKTNIRKSAPEMWVEMSRLLVSYQTSYSHHTITILRQKLIALEIKDGHRIR